MSWNEIFVAGFNLWTRQYISKREEYYECDLNVFQPLKMLHQLSSLFAEKNRVSTNNSLGTLKASSLQSSFAFSDPEKDVIRQDNEALVKFHVIRNLSTVLLVTIHFASQMMRSASYDEPRAWHLRSDWTNYGAAVYLAITLDRKSTALSAGQVVQAKFTLAVSASATGFTDFSNILIVTGTHYCFLLQSKFL